MTKAEIDTYTTVGRAIKEMEGQGMNINILCSDIRKRGGTATKDEIKALRASTYKMDEYITSFQNNTTESGDVIEK